MIVTSIVLPAGITVDNVPDIPVTAPALIVAVGPDENAASASTDPSPVESYLTVTVGAIV